MFGTSTPVPVTCFKSTGMCDAQCEELLNGLAPELRIVFVLKLFGQQLEPELSRGRSGTREHCRRRTLLDSSLCDSRVVQLKSLMVVLSLVINGVTILEPIRMVSVLL
jgi:hypothetical protein